MLDYLSVNIDSNYSFLKLADCVYRVKENTLFIGFLYAEEIEEKIETLKKRLEEEFTKLVRTEAGEIKLVFSYKKSYIDELLLQMEFKKFLKSNFSVLVLDVTDGDIKVSKVGDTYTVNVYLAQNCVDYIRNSKAFAAFVNELEEKNFCIFEFFFDAKDGEGDNLSAMEKLRDYMDNNLPASENVKVDKALKVKSVEYWLGKPIKERPFKIEFLKISGEEQVTAGEMRFITKREYMRKSKSTGKEEVKQYWTFVLNDGHGSLNCVFFPTDKSYPKFEKLVDGTVICAVGVNGSRNGRVSFRVTGISFCQF
jgi:hypothetical protein